VSGRLIVCPTPIGNLEDVTLRVLSALRDADVVACEDTRRTRVLLDRYGVDATLVSYHEHNERARAAELVARMTDGAVVALVSDAGMPLVSDPGYVLVQACVGAGLAVEVLPGPSAALAALVASALPADRWRFVGFLPRKASELVEVFASPETVVAFEAPGRVAASLKALAAIDAERPVAVCRELTKLHEEVRRGDLVTLARDYAAESEPRGEMVIVIAPPAADVRPSEADIDALLRTALAGASVRDAVAEVASLTGQPRAEVYRRALALAKETSENGAPD
jgi:16S rRNA (cytidine1402-2'-O)-methyltransferase